MKKKSRKNTYCCIKFPSNSCSSNLHSNITTSNYYNLFCFSLEIKYTRRNVSKKKNTPEEKIIMRNKLYVQTPNKFLTVKKDNNVVLGSSFSRKYTEFATFLN
jgi:hypothetical protein